MISRSRKRCNADGCDNLRWGKGYCKYHQNLRPDYKPYRYQSKKTGQIEVFLDIWEERQHVSFLSGSLLPKFNVSLFAHVLSKAKNKYPEFKLYKKNIILLTPYEHMLLDHGTKSQREAYGFNWDKIESLKQELLDEYRHRYSDKV